MSKGFSYRGKHWTQLPENKDKVVAMAKQRGSMKRTKFRAIAKHVIGKKRKYKKRNTNNTTDIVVVLYGWRITVTPDGCRIEKV